MDPKNVSDLKKIVSFCRKNGITRVKMEGIELELHPSSLYPESEYKKKKAAERADTDIPLQTEQYSDEELLFWSSAGIPDSKET